MTNAGFTFDPARCIKCWACEIACKQWNGIPASASARRRVFELVEGSYPNVKRTFISQGCLHCDDAQCVRVCPTGAVHVRAEDGAVVVDKDKCIGCRHCHNACPYGIPQFVDGVMDKCDLCTHAEASLSQEPGMPHCVASCPTKALRFEEDDEGRRAYADLMDQVMHRIAGDPDALVW